MRQTFPFAHPRHRPAQALALLKNKIRKYLKRERRKQLPEGADFWDFDCRVGPTEDAAAEVQVSELIRKIDAVSEQGSETVYIEILARPATKPPKPAGKPAPERR